MQKKRHSKNHQQNQKPFNLLLIFLFFFLLKHIRKILPIQVNQEKRDKNSIDYCCLYNFLSPNLNQINRKVDQSMKVLEQLLKFKNNHKFSQQIIHLFESTLNVDYSKNTYLEMFKNNGKKHMYIQKRARVHFFADKHYDQFQVQKKLIKWQNQKQSNITKFQIKNGQKYPPTQSDLIYKKKVWLKIIHKNKNFPWQHLVKSSQLTSYYIKNFMFKTINNHFQFKQIINSLLQIDKIRQRLLRTQLNYIFLKDRQDILIQQANEIKRITSQLQCKINPSKHIPVKSEEIKINQNNHQNAFKKIKK